MFGNAFREALVSRLTELLLPNLTIKDSTLLQAYVTFYSMRPDRNEDTDCWQRYDFVCASNRNMFPRTVLRGVDETKSEYLLRDVADLFLQVSFREFLQFGIPGFVGDVEAVSKLFERSFDSDVVLMAQHIIQVKMTPIEMMGVGESIAESDSMEDVLDKIFNAYCKIERNDSIRIPKGNFLKLYRAVNHYPLDNNELKPVLRFGAEKSTKAMIASISDLGMKLGLSRDQQIEFLYRFFVMKENDPQRLENYKIYHFTQVKEEKERIKLFRSAMVSFGPMAPLECLCAVTLSKRSFRRSSGISEDFVAANDVTLENGLIYSFFSSAVYSMDREGGSAAVFFPSPFFVRKWLDDPILKHHPVIFVFEDDRVRALVEYHYCEGSYTQNIGDNVHFLSFEQWKQSAEERKKVEFSKALLFACGKDITEQDEWYRLIKAYASKPLEIFSLISSYEFEKALSPFSAELSDERISIKTAVLIPQGINNSSRPRRKIFLHCTLSPKGELNTFEREDTKIYSFTLNTDLKTQALSRMIDKPVEIPQQDLTQLYSSVRVLFNQEMLKRRATGRKKVAAFSYEFTPDITIWCSKSYPKSNLSRPRLEAYVCYPANQKKVLQGYMNRGDRVEETCKRVTRIPDNYVSQWLEMEYPFSIMQPRHTSEELKEKSGRYELKPEVDIREEIINVYGPLLKGQDIAVKTLWYLHPDLEDKFSRDGYRLLEQIANTEVGYLRLSDLSAETCESLLTRCFEGETQERLWSRFRVLSEAVDQAVKYGYCLHNPLQIAIHDRYIRDKMFAQVRRALTKKHFTMEEMCKAYQETMVKIETGQTEYIGVLIRLLTGLESNIVCALKVKDFVRLPEYGICQFRVSCQLTNDGSEYKGFDALEDYRSVPCMHVLEERLKQHIDLITKQLPDFAEISNVPLVTTKDMLKKARTRYKPYPPRKLEKLCREIAETVGIEEHIVEIPTDEQGTKETNLNHYSGDFFRANFRHWALEKAKLELDEVQYILGNKPATTFGRYYCDYLNDASQLMMFIKLQRWEAVLAHSDFVLGKAIRINDQSSISREFSLEGQNPLHLHIELMIVRGAGTVTVKISSGFGVTVYSAPIELAE